MSSSSCHRVHISRVLDRGALIKRSWDLPTEPVIEIVGPAPEHIEPIALAALAEWTTLCRNSGREIRVSPQLKTPYTFRTGLLRSLYAPPPRVREVQPTEHFVPLCWFAGRYDAEQGLGRAVGGLLHLSSARATQAIGASIKEIAFNAAEHGKSEHHASFSAGWFRNQRRATFAVADLGPTIRGHMKRKGLLLDTDDDSRAIEKAIQLGITGAGEVGEVTAPANGGQGLFMTLRYVQGCRGAMTIWSGRGLLTVDKGMERIRQTDTRWPGTLVSVTLRPDAIGRFAAAAFEGEQLSTLGIHQNETAPRDAVAFHLPVDAVGFSAPKDWCVRQSPLIEDAIAQGRDVLIDFQRGPYTTQSALHALLVPTIQRFGRTALPRMWFLGLRGVVPDILKHVLNYALTRNRFAEE